MCHRAAQNHRCRPNHNGLSRFLIFYFVFFCFLGFLVVFWLSSARCPGNWPPKGSQAAPKTLPTCPKSSRNLPRSFHRAPEGTDEVLFSPPPLSVSPPVSLQPSVCLFPLASPPLFSPLLSSPLFLSSLCVSSPQALPEDTARRTARERLNIIYKDCSIESL